MNLNTSLLLTDLYELNMLEAYLDDNRTETAVFEFFVRQMPFRRGFLMAAGLEQVLSFLEQARFSEDDMAWLTSTGRFNDKAPIDGFGVGTSLTTSADAPSLDCAYKLQEYAGAPRRKRSSGKATWPGRKQVWRRYDDAGRMVEDTVTLQSEQLSGEPLLECVMTDRRRSHAAVPLAEIRQRAAADLMRLPMHLRAVDPAAAAYAAYPVCIADSIIELAKEADRSLV
jgi:nicotinate phosphoribosyltransferase